MFNKERLKQISIFVGFGILAQKIKSFKMYPRNAVCFVLVQVALTIRIILFQIFFQNGGSIFKKVCCPIWPYMAIVNQYLF